MTKKMYFSFLDFFKKNEKLCKSLIILEKFIEISIYIAYPVFLFMLLIKGNDLWIESALVCGIGFIAVSFLRNKLNAPRPYELYEFSPLIKKDTSGKSFPSRHCFCATIIALNIATQNLFIGIILGVMTFIMAFLRVILGVHFIKDVSFGIFLGIIIGAIILI